MKRKITDLSSNKYFLPTVIISVLLAITLLMLLVVVFGGKPDKSVSDGNVIGSKVASYDVDFFERQMTLTKTLSASTTQLPVLSDPQNKISLSWLTGYDADKTFSVSGMFPGDSVTKEYEINVKSSRARVIYFDSVITSDTIHGLVSLSDILEFKVEFDGQTLYDGLLRDMKQLRYDIFGICDIPFRLTVTMPTHDPEGNPIDNKYSGLSLKTKFTWSLEELSIPPSPPKTSTPIKLTGWTLVGNKVLEGREWQQGDSFDFVLEYKIGDGEYSFLDQKSVTSSDQKIDFSETLSALLLSKKTVYDFRIKESAGNLPDVKYDLTPKTFQIIVGDREGDNVYDILSIAGDGVTLTKDETDSSHDLTFEFKNVYHTDPIPIPEDIELNIPIINTVENETDNKDHEHKFVLENTETGEKQIIIVKQDGSSEFKLTYGAEDVGKTFKYKIYAFDDGTPGVEPSEKVYELIAEVFLNENTNTIYTKLMLDGEFVKEEDFLLSFTTVVKELPPEPQQIDTIVHLFIFPIIILICEGAWFGYIMYVRKKEKEKTENNQVKLNSFATPIVFFTLLVPKWEVVLFIALSCLALIMLVVDIICHIKFVPRKKKDGEQSAQKEVSK